MQNGINLPFGARGHQPGINAWRFEVSRTLGKERTPSQIIRPNGNSGRVGDRGEGRGDLWASKMEVVLLWTCSRMGVQYG
ncbi:hypothetical protein FIBSPDRAFT_868505 [Athelia psychrophila]|uniref:Uncharacterized protein n=1 Tax=Athelia psychrophila TaxID=1759441 RepID=A0A166D395_9AGAM|nr:hypothetical protein FIBSPDRAFT_868505 [Fibularhizoctonia sp. CBS 109695]